MTPALPVYACSGFPAGMTWTQHAPRELHGGRYPSTPFNDAFDDRYQRAFGELPTELAGVAYDAVKLALSAADGGAARPLPAEAIAAAGKVDGALGPVAMSAAGVALRPLEVLEMRPDGVFPVSPATIVASRPYRMCCSQWALGPSGRDAK